jgi:thiol:disulfide interchange protein DsbC
MNWKNDENVRLGLLACLVTVVGLSIIKYASAAEYAHTFRMYEPPSASTLAQAQPLQPIAIRDVEETPTGLAMAAEPDFTAMTEHLKALAKNAEIPTPVETPVPGIYETKVGGQYTYVTADGRFAFVGTLLDLPAKQNLTKLRMDGESRIALAEFGEQHMVVFPADGEELGKLKVFTDPSCGYCRKLHQEVSDLQAGGVTVEYIPFPRMGPGSPTAQTLENIWCAVDPNMALSVAMEVIEGEVGTASGCDAAKAVEKGYELAMALGLQGTPVMFIENGNRIDGWVPADKLTGAIRALHAARNQQASAN